MPLVLKKSVKQLVDEALAEIETLSVDEARALLGQPDVTRIGVLLIALVAMALFLVRRHGLELEVVRTAVPARIAIDERAVVTVRVRNGELTLFDGPFAETKEMLAGFYLIDAPDLNAAIQIAAGRYHVCALLADSALRCWGFNATGQLGYGNTDNIGDDETPASAGDVPFR